MTTPRSQNGYSANDRSKIATYNIVPGVKLALRKGDVATVLIYVARQFDRRVEKLVPGTCWGYAERLIRGSSTMLSNHASGTANDDNAVEHPLGVPVRRTFSQYQIDTIHKILKECHVNGHPVVRWGGDYNGRPDSMHFEIIGTPAQVKMIALRIKHPPIVINPDGGPVGRFPLLKGHYYAIEDSSKFVHSGYYAKDKSAIRRIQKEVGVKMDGIYGIKTAHAVHAWTVRRGLIPVSSRVSAHTWEAMTKG